MIPDVLAPSEEIKSLLMESMRAWMNLQKKYWKSDADGNAGIEMTKFAYM